MGGTFTQIAVMLGVLQYMLQVNDQTVKVTKELLRQHEEQRLEEMALLLEMEQSSQEVPELTLGSLVLSACQHWWFWASAEMVLVLFGFYWLPRQGSSGYGCGETPAVPRRKRRRRRKKRMHATADYSDKLDEVRSPDLCLDWKDMQNSEKEGIKGMINASAKPFCKKGQYCIQGIPWNSFPGCMF